eukprot:GEMP01133617.1.p1 GENE.GEMP01133617.1~~GEMP01133617.1.p1  ORF type:complete len:100 (-),score=2.18 GEMP01133617.1:12-311(-)
MQNKKNYYLVKGGGPKFVLRITPYVDRGMDKEFIVKKCESFDWCVTKDIYSIVPLHIPNTNNKKSKCFSVAKCDSLPRVVKKCESFNGVPQRYIRLCLE